MREAVEIVVRDGIVLRAELEEGGPAWLVLVHEPGSDLDFWRPLSLAARGLSVLALDLRGHGGSEGAPDPALVARDLADAVAFARARGAEAVVLGAAGDSVAPTLEAAGPAGALGVVAIAPSAVEEGDGRFPKLVVVSAHDDLQVAAAAGLQHSPGSAIVISLPLAGGAAEIVSSEWRTNVEAYVSSFVRDASRPLTEARR